MVSHTYLPQMLVDAQCKSLLKINAGIGPTMSVSEEFFSTQSQP